MEEGAKEFAKRIKKWLVWLAIILVIAVIVFGIFTYFKPVQKNECEVVEDQNFRDSCYYMQAKASGDSSMCEKIIATKWKDACVSQTALRK